MGGRQILPRSISHFNVLMIPSVAILNANKKIMLPATIAISRGFPAAVNSTVEKLLTRCLMILDTRRKLSATHTSLMKQKAFTEPEIHQVYVCVLGIQLILLARESHNECSNTMRSLISQAANSVSQTHSAEAKDAAHPRVRTKLEKHRIQLFCLAHFPQCVCV